jgi:uncharacterized protein YndB with AHSA1/START domain
MIDIVKEIDATKREVGEATTPTGPGHVIRLQRDYDAPIEDVWDAFTDPDRIGRWFLPISGDYRLGGRYQFEGNAGGEIVACERPERLKVTWAYGVAASDADVSEVEVRLSKLDDASTRLDFEHTSVVPDEMWSEYGPGAVGVGWDQGVLGLARHLHGDPPLDPAAWPMSAEGRSFFGRSSQAWGAANKAAGADSATVARNITNATAFYAPDPEAT